MNGLSKEALQNRAVSNKSHMKNSAEPSSQRNWPLANGDTSSESISETASRLLFDWSAAL
jgi:hypothetical protein